ncbi:hypothetical protein DFJ58DRAFT_251460 [Suillus subalutaceus]|uniref:uncharacterized protein n=1 Tax=Suillus subalutaceus TaxID=48586 RepID=UPI001B87D625|nr:uncharacterized protein DFJ58DRAFT_251460 [Suillus subalutaceus]KAG1861583.1 hypothetical protein DFJ58DRAFT_251460 [Suillus subalutaceus]
MISDFLALEELTISLDCSNPEATVIQSISQPPCTLRSLTVNGVFFDTEYASTFNPTWAHLTNIEIDLDEPITFLRLLRLCPSLSSLMIYTSFNAMEALEPFTHTQLQSLRIVSDDVMTTTQTVLTYSIPSHCPICTFSKLTYTLMVVMRNSRHF